ncbi:MAG: ATP-binding protein, partial [Gemmatimonadaceae bacterium]
LQQSVIEQREHLEYRVDIDVVQQQLITRAAGMGDLASIVVGTPSLVDCVKASGAAMFHHNQWYRLGNTPDEAELSALSSWMQHRAEFDSTRCPVYASNALATVYPAAAAYSHNASGVVATFISRRKRDVLMWFRPELIQTIPWAGNPHEKPVKLGVHGARLTPRQSFALFRESVSGQSAPWLSTEVEAINRFRLHVIELVVNQAEVLAGLNADLVRSNRELDAFAYIASHDLKEPLRGIHQYAGELLSDVHASDDTRRQKVDNMLRLTKRMDGLLDSLLDFARAGHAPMQLASVDLNDVVADAIEMVSARRNESITRFFVPRPLPVVQCDYNSVCEIFVNLFSNAIKYNNSAGKFIEVGFVAATEDFDRSSFPAEAANQIVYFVRDNGIGIDTRHFDQIFRMFRRLHARSEFGGGSGAGLTIVRKMVTRHRGKVWLSSQTGIGTTFFFDLRDAAT